MSEAMVMAGRQENTSTRSNRTRTGPGLLDQRDANMEKITQGQKQEEAQEGTRCCFLFSSSDDDSKRKTTSGLESDPSAQCSVSHFLVAQATDAHVHRECRHANRVCSQTFPAGLITPQLAVCCSPRRRRKWSWPGPPGSLGPELIVSRPRPSGWP